MFRNYAKLIAIVLVVVISSASTLLAQYTACISTGFTVGNPSAPTYGEVANDGTYTANFQVGYTNTCGNGYFSNCNICKYKYITQNPSTDKLYEEYSQLPGFQPCGTEVSYTSTFTASGLVPGGPAYNGYVEFSKYKPDLGNCGNLGSKITVSVEFSQ